MQHFSLLVCKPADFFHKFVIFVALLNNLWYNISDYAMNYGGITMCNMRWQGNKDIKELNIRNAPVNFCKCFNDDGCISCDKYRSFYLSPTFLKFLE